MSKHGKKTQMEPQREVPGEDPQPLTQDLSLTFTGNAHTLVHKPHEGFANYAIATLVITNGIVTKMELSQPYNAWEAKIKMEVMNDGLLENLRRTYPGEYRHG